MKKQNNAAVADRLMIRLCMDRNFPAYAKHNIFEYFFRPDIKMLNAGIREF